MNSCIHKLSVEARGVHAASSEERREGFGESSALDFRTVRRAEARAPFGTDNLWMHRNEFVFIIYIGGSGEQGGLACGETNMPQASQLEEES